MLERKRMVCYNKAKEARKGGGGMYIAVCDDQTEELKDLTELLGAWETDRGTARAREELPQRGGAAGRGAP